MHPSNYTQLGRRRHNSRGEREQKDSQNVPIANHLAVNSPLGSERKNIKRSCSGSDVACLHSEEKSSLEHKISNRHSHPNICGNTNGEIRSSIHQDLEWDSFTTKDKPECSVDNTQSSSGNNLEGIVVVDSASITQATCSVRRRSGSWSGVNESDDDVEQLTCAQNPPVHIIGGRHYQSGSISSAQEMDDELNPISYQNSYSTCSTDTSVTRNHFCTNEEKMKKRLKFYFMNPVEKWVAKGRFPWKLLLQIVKILIVTVQLCLFASQRYNHVTYLWDTRIAFSHLFIKGWDPSREITAYPPSSGPLALYKVKDFYDFMDYAIIMFFSVEHSAIGSYNFERENGDIVLPTFCYSQFKNKDVNFSSRSYTMDNNIITECIDIPSTKNGSWSMEEFLKGRNNSINFDRLLQSTFTFRLQTVRLRVNLPYELPECYRLDGIILLDNSDQDGQMLVELDVTALILECEGSVNSNKEDKEYHIARKIINGLTIGICSLSCLMCIRALYRAQKLRGCTNELFKMRFRRELSGWEKFEFVNLWYVLIIINDVLIITGSIIKVGLETEMKYISSDPLLFKKHNIDYDGYLDKWNICSLFLGLGNLFVWFGCLRYLGFFKTYNFLILTIKSCFPSVVRYSFCILMVFAGYSFCGWLVLGPYHLKFRSLSSTIECLYSLINGDDMFATFSCTTGKDFLVWWFSRVYLYSFISLFIYVILSLFIAIIMDAYDTVKGYYQHGFPHSDLRKFANECLAEPHSGEFLDEEDFTIRDLFRRICCCCCCSWRRHATTDGYAPITT